MLSVCNMCIKQNLKYILLLIIVYDKLNLNSFLFFYFYFRILVSFFYIIKHTKNN